jgi:uncharacterized protein (TIGR02996 family)
MAAYPACNPRAVALLLQAKEAPQDDAPRLVLADWLEDNGDPDRAAFVRLQCQLARLRGPEDQGRSGPLLEASGRLLARHGGGWLGPLWRWRLSPLAWHRGMLATRLPRGCDVGELCDVLPWLDTAVLTLSSREGFCHAAAVLPCLTLNHLCLDVRPAVRLARLLSLLAQAPASPCLRSLSVAWPAPLCRLEDRGQTRAVPDVGARFLGCLLGELPLARSLTHLASSPAWGADQEGLIRAHGVVPARAEPPLWMHGLPAASFAAPQAGLERNARRSTRIAP